MSSTRKPVQTAGALDRPVLSAGYAAIALSLQEAATDELSSSDVSRRITAALQDAARDSGTWCYYIDHFGDGESGDVIYSCGGDTKRAPYTMGTVAGKVSCSVDTTAAIDVMPRTIYEEEAEDADHYAAMESAKLYESLPIYERFIPKSERASAPAGSFAGKGKSFPILKPADVMAAVRSIHRAGSENYDTGTLKRNIVKIAANKGWHKHLPKAWQPTSGKESAGSQSSELSLVESAATLDPIVLREARADYEIKLIAPGKGSSAWYPAEALRRSGPKVFKSGMHVYRNHATAAEEAARPEGDVTNLAGVLTTDAVYHETHAKGPGLYARMKVFSDHGQLVEEKAAHVGMSIRAGGLAEAGETRDGLPVLKEFTSAQSVDVVTRAGAGGLILTEAAAPPIPTQQEDSMDAAELTKLQESLASQAAINQQLLKRALKGDAREEAVRILKTTSLVEAARGRVIDTVIAGEIPQTDGALDTVKFAVIVNEAAKTEGAYVASLIGSGQVVGMGVAAVAPVVQIDAAEADRQKAAKERRFTESVQAFRNIGLPEDAAKRAAERGKVA